MSDQMTGPYQGADNFLSRKQKSTISDPEENESF